ncbi:MAG: tyrosine--tRNA ligase [Saprospiraceae bacterium]|jgi:tyrosyl-tRNA synthetase|nr:tyrosine--tRNA ligase [Saprospiraceae bacterium]
MNFIKELSWRGMLQDSTPGAEAFLNEGPTKGYIGFDPTAPSMTIGNYVQLMILRLFQLSGHTPIILMGGATGRIGDPSGKDKERQLKSFEELDSNLNFQLDQVKKFLSFEGENAAIVVNNLDFYKEMNVLNFLRDVGKTLTVSYMMSKDSVKNRLESGLSFTEFSYQLMQAYDFQKLYTDQNCRIQMGGSDQWGNITSGTEFIRRNVSGKAYAVTTPLLTKSDGKKFGKSEEGNLWLDPKMTTPYKFYQFWINADDADIPTFIRYFTLKTQSDVESLEVEHADNPRKLKEILAEELTRRVHSDQAYESVMNVSEILFGRTATEDSLKGLAESDLETISKEIKSYCISKSDLSNGIKITDLLSNRTEVLKSRSEAKRAVKNNAISINKVKITSDEHMLTFTDLIHDKYIMLENGKKNKFMLIFV